MDSSILAQQVQHFIGGRRVGAKGTEGGRMADVFDPASGQVARRVLLASRAGSWMTGQTIVVDGGSTS